MSKLLIDVDELAAIFKERADYTGDEVDKIATLHRRMVYCQEDLTKTWAEIIRTLVDGKWPEKNLLVRHNHVIARTGEALVALGEYLIESGTTQRGYVERVLDVLEDSVEPEVGT